MGFVKRQRTTIVSPSSVFALFSEVVPLVIVGRCEVLCFHVSAACLGCSTRTGCVRCCHCSCCDPSVFDVFLLQSSCFLTFTMNYVGGGSWKGWSGENGEKEEWGGGCWGVNQVWVRQKMKKVAWQERIWHFGELWAESKSVVMVLWKR